MVDRGDIQTVVISEAIKSVIAKYTIAATGFVGLILIGRSGRLLTKFKSANQIPERFITRHVKLQGFVRSIDEVGNLKIEHQRLIHLPYLNNHTKSLNVSLAGVILKEGGVNYLKSNFMSEKVWFRLMNRIDSNSLDCIILHKPSFWKLIVNVNEEVVKRGLGLPKKVNENDAIWARFMKRLNRAEGIAIKKRVGVWKIEELTLFEKLSDYIPANPFSRYLKKRSS
ncbi:DgyrCDS10992 [Dimorphilus gyrociliatus]|uniref:DgyrCDS10992 n=1 Tax=Dimorphilus gyrociliatus TaxID=2664684 RepID=A0A7I8W4I1_9ANNE|nr:DgyrCDS10992 [Dimorphilus gyrociliatus]